MVGQELEQNIVTLKVLRSESGAKQGVAGRLLVNWAEIRDEFIKAHGREPKPYLESLWEQLQIEAQSLFTRAHSSAIIPRPISKDGNRGDQALVEAKKRIAIADLIEDLRRKQKPATDQESLFSFYNRGLISKRELTRSSVGLGEFLREHDVHIRTGYYHAIHACFADIDGVFMGKTIEASGLLSKLYSFRVDPEVMEQHLPDLREFKEKLTQINHLPRTEEEKKYYQGKLLRVLNETGFYETVSLDYALEELARRANRHFRMKGFRLEYKDLATEALVRSLPYLRGERRDFDNFGVFLRYFYTIMNNMCNDIWGRKKLKTVSFDAMQEMTGEEIIPESNVDSNVGHRIDSNSIKEALQKLSGLKPEEILLLQLRSEGLSYAIIKRFIRGKSEIALRIIMHRLLNKLNSKRQKR